MLNGKKVLLGVSSSIAAYKSASLIRLLTKAGADVQVVMTESAKDFITPLTLSTLSKKPVYSEFTRNEQGEWNNHVELALWADLILIAPATARTISKCANGACDDLLTAIYLSARCPVIFAPAMDLDMYVHPSTRINLEKLKSFGNTLVDAPFGELASGLSGKGRMAEPEDLLEVVTRSLLSNPAATQKKVLITAGPTQEALDPVRYITNHSTGKMGYAIAKAFYYLGCEVTVVSGPVHLGAMPFEIIPVSSAQSMFEITRQKFADYDLVIFSAAVADYTPKHVSDKKIKKKEQEFILELTKTTDIAMEIGRNKRPGQLTMGFALETDHELENAQRKLQAKKLDFIVLNSLQDAGAGFMHDTNKITVIEKDGLVRNFELKSKTEVARDIVEIILEKWEK